MERGRDGNQANSNRETENDQKANRYNKCHTQNEKGENKPKSTNSNLIKLLNAF